MTITPPGRPAQHGEIRRHNTAAVLQSVVTAGPLSRAEIANRVGLSQGTVSKIVGPVLSSGLLVEGPARAAAGGRPQVPLAINPGARLAVGLHLGMQRTTVGLVDMHGHVRAVRVRSRRPAGPERLTGEAAEMVAKLIAQAEAPVLGVGATTGGWVDGTSGVVLANEALGWSEVPLAQLIASRIDVPVLVESSVRAQAGAELWFGCAQHARSTVHVFVGNVIDAAFAIDRKIHRGLRSAAGLTGHLPLAGGTPHTVATDKAVVATARESGLIGDGEGLPGLAARARAGDLAADAVLSERARQVGVLVGMLVDLLDPDLVVLAGGVLAVPGHLDVVREAVAARSRPGWDPARVVATALGPDLLVSSSAAVVLGAYVADPLAFEDFG